MRERLPVHIEDRELPMDKYNKTTSNREFSYGYVSVLYLASIIITIASVMTIIILGNR